MNTRPDRKFEFIGALTFTIPIGFFLSALANINLVAGGAAITLVVTAALLIRAT